MLEGRYQVYLGGNQAGTRLNRFFLENVKDTELIGQIRPLLTRYAHGREGIPFEIVPGDSSLQAVPGYAGIPVTHRLYSSQLVVVTGHEDPLSPENKQDWPALARLSGTLVVLMGLQRHDPMGSR